jgi:hypothetical protein
MSETPSYRERGAMSSGNPSPHAARQGKKAKRRAEAEGTLKDLTDTLWRAVKRLDECLDTITEGDEIDTAELCKVTHALAQSAGVYIKVIEAGELEARLAALEEQRLVA